VVWVEVVGFKQVSKIQSGEGLAFFDGVWGSGCRPAGRHIPWFDQFSNAFALATLASLVPGPQKLSFPNLQFISPKGTDLNHDRHAHAKTRQSNPAGMSPDAHRSFAAPEVQPI
jgi:hypothetical protein